MYLKENRLVYGKRGNIDNYSNLNSFFTLAFYNIQINLDHPVSAPGARNTVILLSTMSWAVSIGSSKFGLSIVVSKLHSKI